MRRKCERITRKFRRCPGRFAPRVSHDVFPRSSSGFAPFLPTLADTRNSRETKRRAPEELEVEREETDDEVAGGGGSSSVFESSSSSYTTKTYGGSGVLSTSDIFPEGVSFPFGSEGFGGFPFRGWLGGGGAESPTLSPPSFFGAMATVFRGMYEFAREMERLEKGEEKQTRAAEPTAPAKLGDEDE
jgi:hypothetical protein